MKVSIVMAYYNRWTQLVQTLESIHLSMRDVEVIIVDDGSDENNSLEGYVDPYLDIKVIRVKPENKTWTSACIPFNIGFKEATGDIIIIQSPECLHVGDIISSAIRNVHENKYVAFACYSAGKEKSEAINNYKKFILPEDAEKILSPFNNNHPSADGEDGWYCHSQYNPNAFAFCAAMTKKDLDELGGFDERYSQGIGYEDFEFIARIRRKGMSVDIIDNPYVIHQRHTPTDYEGKKELHNRNHKLYYGL